MDSLAYITRLGIPNRQATLSSSKRGPNSFKENVLEESPLNSDDSEIEQADAIHEEDEKVFKQE